jgi:microsomal epoxide hydrolase
MSNIINQLLLDLGFGAGYLAQGGDIGAAVSRMLAVEHRACKGALLNFTFMPLDPPAAPLETLTEYEIEGVKKAAEFMMMGAAYNMEQATRPATIGLVLGSSPLALLAWIGEKFLEWSDVSPDLDTILESVTLYWFTESMGRGLYPYRAVCFLLLFSSLPYLRKTGD